jgi:outer membrane protein assembly factor BamB
MPYPHVPSTPASRSDGDVVFGGRGGHLVWLGFRDDKVPARVRERRVPGQEAAVDVAAVHCVLYEELVHRLKGGFSAVPVASGDVVIACSTSGQVSCFRTSQRACVWSIQLPGGVAAQPAIGEGVCYVASRDQHLRCLDLATGKTLWKWFCESTLENPPLLAGELVMLQVPELGLVAFETGGSASRTRSPKWKSAASGNPITRLAEGVLVWDATSRKLSLVDQSTGVVRDERTLTEVDSVHASAPIGGELYLMSSDGRVQRCVPVSPVTTASKPGVAETPAAAAPQEATSPAGDETSEPPVDPAGN